MTGSGSLGAGQLETKMEGGFKNGVAVWERVHGSFDVHISTTGGRATAGGPGELSEVSSGTRPKGTAHAILRAAD